MSLKYELSSEPLYISAKQLFLNSGLVSRVKCSEFGLGLGWTLHAIAMKRQLLTNAGFEGSMQFVTIVPSS